MRLRFAIAAVFIIVVSAAAITIVEQNRKLDNLEHELDNLEHELDRTKTELRRFQDATLYYMKLSGVPR